MSCFAVLCTLHPSSSFWRASARGLDSRHILETCLSPRMWSKAIKIEMPSNRNWNDRNYQNLLSSTWLHASNRAWDVVNVSTSPTDSIVDMGSSEVVAKYLRRSSLDCISGLTTHSQRLLAKTLERLNEELWTGRSFSYPLEPNWFFLLSMPMLLFLSCFENKNSDPMTQHRLCGYTRSCASSRTAWRVGKQRSKVLHRKRETWEWPAWPASCFIDIHASCKLQRFGRIIANR